MKTLKLTGLDTFTSPLLNYDIVRKGNVVTLDDHVADRLLPDHEWGPEGKVPHWTELVADPEVKADFHHAKGVETDSAEPAKAETEQETQTAAEPVVEPPVVAASAQEPANAATSAAPKKTQRVARKA